MTQSTNGSDADATGGPCPIEIAFSSSGVPEGLSTPRNMVTFSPATHHPGLLPVEKALAIYRNCDDSTVQGSGMHTPREIVMAAYQLQDEYGDDVTAGIYAQITTRDHERYPRTIVFGFSVVVDDTATFTLPRTVRAKVRDLFDDADLIQTSRGQITVLVSDHPFTRGDIEIILEKLTDSW